MTDESTPRIDERPSTHKKKMQSYLMAALGVVFFVLLGMVVLNVYNKMQERKAPPKEADTVGAVEPADRQTQFEKLATSRPPHTAPTSSVDADFNKIGAGMPPQKQDNAVAAKGGPADEESAESKAVKQWRAREQLRALSAANSKWGLPKVTKPGQGSLGATSNLAASSSGHAALGDVQEQIDHLNRPMDESMSLDDRRAEVKRRIAEAQKLRLSLEKNGAAGLPGAAGRPDSTSGLSSTQPQLSVPQMPPTAPQLPQVPTNVVGYPKKNQYGADTAGMIKVPPGSEIMTTLMKKGISDYSGSSLKAIANRDVYDISRRYVLFPQGTEFTVKMVRTKNVNEAISDRVGFLVKDAILPNGDSIDFSTASVADREGVGAIGDKTDYHIMAQFLGVAAYALIGTGTSRKGSGDDETSYAGDVGEDSRKQFSPLAEKYLNIVPTQIIRPGQSFQIVIEKEMFVKPWSDLYAKYTN